MAKPLISTKAVCSVVMISFISPKVDPRGQNLFRVCTQTSEIKGAVWLKEQDVTWAPGDTS